MSSYKCQDEGTIKHHECVLIYKSESERDKNHSADNNLIGFTTKMFAVKRLEEINTRYNSNRLEKMTIFQCMDKVETVKCFLGESSNEQDSRSGKNETKEKAWPQPNLKETAHVKGKRTSALTERSSQKNQPFSEKEMVHKLNKKNSEKTSVFLVQRSFAPLQVERLQDKIEDFPLRNFIAPTGSKDERDISCLERLSRRENSSVGDDTQVSVDKTEQPLLKETKSDYRSKEDNSRGDTEKTGKSTTGNETVLGKCSNTLECIDKTNGHQVRERSTSNANVLSSQVPGNSAIGAIFQDVEQTEHTSHSKRRVVEERSIREGNKKSRMHAADTAEGHTTRRTRDSRQAQGSLQDQTLKSTGMNPTEQQDLVTPLDDLQAPPAPFSHRNVTAKQLTINNYYTINRAEILGGGRFGQVHKCEEKATGLTLAAKIIKARSIKEKDEVKNEINIMNQLDHVNLIQLYDAFESRNDIILVMEYVDGGELFDRIIDDNYNLTELDTILFIKQICEGIRHMHQMYILHLDLKPENILCVNRDAKQIKIIDFGLARRYKPREKLKVNFGTPEFLAPEVVNYDFVSFPTDMWSVGVIAYMLLSGLSPFLGDNDAETLTNILACRWDLEEEEFQDISDEARDFISKLLIKEKSWRISASEALKHPWLSDHTLHSRLKTEKKIRRSDAQDPVTK